MGDLEVELMTWGGARDKFVFRDFYQIVLDFEDHGGLELSATFLKGGTSLKGNSCGQCFRVQICGFR